MCIFIDHKWRKCHRAAQNIILLYDILNENQKVKDMSEKAVLEFDEEEKPLRGNLYYIFMLDLCQCHKTVESPILPEKDNTDALLIFTAHVLGYKASSYKDFMKMRNDPDVMEKYNKTAAGFYKIASANPGRIFLPELLAHCSKTLMKNAEYVMKVYGNYLCDIENRPYDNHRNLKWLNILRQSYDM